MRSSTTTRSRSSSATGAWSSSCSSVAEVDVGNVVRVTGTVREQDFDALAAELDFELEEDLYSPADPQQVIVAQSVEVI